MTTHEFLGWALAWAALATACATLAVGCAWMAVADRDRAERERDEARADAKHWMRRALDPPDPDRFDGLDGAAESHIVDG